MDKLVAWLLIAAMPVSVAFAADLYVGPGEEYESIQDGGSGVVVDGLSVLLNGNGTTLYAINTTGTGHSVVNAGDITVSGTASWSAAAIAMSNPVFGSGSGGTLTVSEGAQLQVHVTADHVSGLVAQARGAWTIHQAGSISVRADGLVGTGIIVAPLSDNTNLTLTGGGSISVEADEFASGIMAGAYYDVFSGRVDFVNDALQQIALNYSGDVALELGETARVHGDISLGGSTNTATLYAGTVLSGTLQADAPGQLYLKGARAGDGRTELEDVLFFETAEVEGGRWIFTADAGLDAVHEWLLGLTLDEKAKAQAAFDSMSGEVYAVLPALAAQRLDGVISSVAQGLTQEGESGRQFWAVARGSAGRVNGSAEHGTAAADVKLQGVTVGVDLLERGGARAGLLAGYLEDTLTMDARWSVAQGSSVYLGGYGQWELGSVTLQGVAGYSAARNDAERQVLLGDTVHTARGSFTTTDTVVALTARYDGWSVGQVRLVPGASLSRYTTQREGFVEKGAGSVGLTVQPYAAEWVRGRLELELVPVQAAESGSALHARFAWVNDFGAADRKVRVRFSGVGDEAFTVVGTPVQTSGFEMTLGVGGAVREHVTWGVSYMGQFRGDGNTQQVQGTIAISF